MCLERELATLKAGQPVSLVADALPGKRFTGVVDRVAPVVDSGSGTFRVICAFADAQAEALQPGMFGRIRIDYDQRTDALVVPRLALLEDGDPAVFVVREGKVTRVPIKLGYAEGQWVEVRDGLKEGDQVVTAGKVALRDGTAVQVIGEPQAGAEGGAGDRQGRRGQAFIERRPRTSRFARSRTGRPRCIGGRWPGGIRHPPPRDHRDDHGDHAAVRRDRAPTA